MRLQIAFRNVFRNRRRTALNLIMIAASCAAIIDFRGIASNLVRRLEAIAINGQFGHIQVASDKFWSPSASDRPVGRTLASDPSLTSRISALPEVRYVGKRLTFYSLITNGDNSLSARGVGFDPSVESDLRETLPIIEGARFKGDAKFQILMGSGLKKQLGLKVGSSITLVANTYDGAVNAVDADFVGVFQTGLDEIDNTTFYVSLGTAQSLLETDRFETYVVQLKDTNDVAEVQAKVAGMIPGGLTAKSWSELATHYRKVRNLCAIINRVTLTILIVLALLSVGNTIGMSIFERTGEIGTLRAIGDQRSEILKQFLLEGVILGALGGVIGCALSVLVAYVVGRLQIPVEIPGNSVATSIEIDLGPSFMMMAFMTTFLMSLVATASPAYVASKREITDALRRNI